MKIRVEDWTRDTFLKMRAIRPQRLSSGGPWRGVLTGVLLEPLNITCPHLSSHSCVQSFFFMAEQYSLMRLCHMSALSVGGNSIYCHLCATLRRSSRNILTVMFEHVRNYLAETCGQTEQLSPVILCVALVKCMSMCKCVCIYV